MKVTYSSNNSGGDWWLKDKDWKALEKAGWTVIWGGWYFCNSSWWELPKGKKKCGKKNCPGHRKYKTAKQADKDRYMGALASYASKDFPSIEDAKEEWSRIVGQDPKAEGCNCCGQPHYFS